MCKFRNGENPDDVVLDSWFEGEGEIEPELLSDCIEIVETWSPKDCEVLGNFDVVFARRNGNGEISGKATTVYDLSECSRALSMPRHRRIVFPKFTDLEDGFELIQTSCLTD